MYKEKPTYHCILEAKVNNCFEKEKKKKTQKLNLLIATCFPGSSVVKNLPAKQETQV